VKFGLERYGLALDELTRVAKRQVLGYYTNVGDLAAGAQELHDVGVWTNIPEGKETQKRRQRETMKEGEGRGEDEGTCTSTHGIPRGTPGVAVPEWPCL
jgi:hypothetical protein